MPRLSPLSHEMHSRLVYAATHVAIIAIDPNGIIQIFNAGSTRMLGFESSEMVCIKDFASLVPKPRLASVLSSPERAAYSPECRVRTWIEQLAGRTDENGEECTLVRKDGSELVAQIHVAAILDDEQIQIGYLITLYDLTRRKRLEDDLIEACRIAEDASLQKTHFLTHMSHEIRSPLASILGNAELLADPGIKANDRDSSLKAIQRSGQHLLSLVNNILDLAKIEAGKMAVDRRHLSPVELIEEALDIFQEAARSKNIELSYKVVGDIPKVIWSDSMRIKQILVNLISNAIKFTHSGNVQVIVRSQPSESRQNDPASPSRMSFSVKDTGIGIAQDHQKRLFAPFVQASKHTASEYGGTGLGLAISRRIAQLLDGDLSVESSLGKGSTFTATIGVGVRADSSSDEMKPSAIVQKLPIQNIEGRILLVDDSIDIQRLVRAFLTNAGAKVDIADNGQAAIELILGTHGNGPQSVYDLVLMDMQMPIMDGCVTTQVLRSRGYDGPIVALTANAMLEDRDRCFAAGFTDFATKPINRHELLAICHHWIT